MDEAAGRPGELGAGRRPGGRQSQWRLRIRYSNGQTVTPNKYDHELETTTEGFVSGLGTGIKAVTNETVRVIGETLTLGFAEDIPNVWEVTDKDRANGYDQAAIFAKIGANTGLGLLTGGASGWGRAGTVIRYVGMGVRGLDIAGNVVNLGRGIVDAYNNGLTLGNSVQIVSNSLGLAGNLSRGTNMPGSKIALGIEPHLDEFASGLSAASWKQFAKQDPSQWKSFFVEVMNNPKNSVFFNLKDVDVWGGIGRASAGIGGATDWELLQIAQNKEWWAGITWVLDGVKKANPFG